MVVSRLELKATIARLLRLLLKVPAEPEAALPSAEILPPVVVKPERRARAR
jgi:acetyl-CoA carboxylase carboxyl transferase subunit beta